MTPSTPLLHAGRVLPFTAPARVARRSTWPFPVRREPVSDSLQGHAARVVATSARHWLGLR